jgi:hypothetical protein
MLAAVSARSRCVSETIKGWTPWRPNRSRAVIVKTPFKKILRRPDARLSVSKAKRNGS